MNTPDNPNPPANDVCPECRRELKGGWCVNPTCNGTGKAPSIEAKPPLESVDGNSLFANSELAAPDAGPTPITRAQCADATATLKQFARENDEGLSIVGGYGALLETNEHLRANLKAAVDLLGHIGKDLEASKEVDGATWQDMGGYLAEITAFLAELKGQKL